MTTIQLLVKPNIFNINKNTSLQVQFFYAIEILIKLKTIITVDKILS